MDEDERNQALHQVAVAAQEATRRETQLLQLVLEVLNNAHGNVFTIKMGTAMTQLNEFVENHPFIEHGKNRLVT